MTKFDYATSFVQEVSHNNGTAMDFSWVFGRSLYTVDIGGTSIRYAYDQEGIRTSKTVGNTYTQYHIIDGVMYGEKTMGANGTTEIFYFYDDNDRMYGFSYNGTMYYYQFNLQGDVTGIYDANGQLVVEYKYDAWGKVLSITGTLANTIGQNNPIRYRGYYFDNETGFYLTGTRYYDPEIGRFINADNQIVAVGGNILGYNMFAYCLNNPVNYFDPTGESAEVIRNTWISSMWWLTLIDGILPIGDVVYWGGAVIIGVVAIGSVATNIKNNHAHDSKKKEDANKPVVKPGQQPTEKEGYVAPKKGPVKGKNKDGKVGWKDKNGNIWVPQPTGSAGAHGGGHWDVQSPKGGYVNVYPGGIIRGGKAPYPNIIIFP